MRVFNKHPFRAAEILVEGNTWDNISNFAIAAQNH
jgi:hypothetical protein